MLTKRSPAFFISLICIIGFWLFYLKYTVVTIEDRIQLAKKDIVVERKNHHILKAEWKALTSPGRIQHLATRHLRMQQMEPAQLREFDSAIFHSEKSKSTKKLSKLVSEILNDKASELSSLE